MAEKVLTTTVGPTELTAQNTFVTLLGVLHGERVAISARDNSMSGCTWRVQRRFNGQTEDTNWKDITDTVGIAITFIDIAAEVTYEADCNCDLRAGINTGDYGSGGVFITLRKG